MSTLASGGPAAVENTSSHWVPHGPVLTACVVGVNVLMILLIIFLFWRFFSGEAGPSTSAADADAEDDEDDDEAPVASPWASRWRHEDLAQPLEYDVAALALPVYIYSGAAAGADEEGGKAEECAVCIVELRDGDSASVLPRCGHRFHADCIGAWLRRRHTTCPLCRASVVAPAAAAATAVAAADESTNAAAKDDDEGAAVDCPV
nr:unnamed protein product [Digitaria exilis]